MKTSLISWLPDWAVVAVVVLCSLHMTVPEASAAWEAYNDSAYKSGQVNADNVTTIGLGRNFEGEGTSGVLRNFITGEATSVRVEYLETFSTGSINSGGDPAFYEEGTDAWALFHDKVDISGNMSYGDSPGWAADLVITGLDPTKRYTFAGTANRNGGPGYASRVTNWKIIGAESFTYASSAGAQKIAEDSVEFSTGDNSAGYVAAWTNIDPGADGTVIIRTSHTVGEANGGSPGASPFQGYAGGVFMLREQAAGEFRWVAYNDSAFKEGQVNSSFVTTIGLGRNFTGQGSSGVLTNLYSGQPTGVTATYVETFSTGSVNSAGDVAFFTPGTDAEAYFGGVVDISGNMSYGDSPGWYVDLIFSGLDPAKSYTFVGTADRNGGPGYAARVTNWKIIGAESYTYASSETAHRVSEDSVEFSTGDNSAGNVARWTNIRPGVDGTFTIRTSHTVGEANGGLPGASAFQGYAGGVFLLGEQLVADGPDSHPITFSSLQPAAGAVEVHPNTPVVVVLQHGDAAVKADSIVLKVDNVEVTPVVEAGDTATTVSYTFPAPLPSASTLTLSLAFTDTSETAVSYSREWSFTVLDYSGALTLPAAMAEDYNPAVHQARGFAMQIVAPDPADELPLGTIDDAVWLFDSEYHNRVNPGLFNALGYYIEAGVINYQIDQEPKGAKANESRFPGIPGSGTLQPFALQAQTLLHLSPGYHRFNVTTTPGFVLFVGSGGNEMELPFFYSPCANCGGDDAPWYSEVVVTKEGLYPFRLVYYSDTGSASLEWLTVSPTGTRPLINENAPHAIPAYVPAWAQPAGGGESFVRISRSGDNVVIEWGGGTLETSTDLLPNWTPVPSATSPYVVPISEIRRFYRVSQ